jgi:hypothetical protein
MFSQEGQQIAADLWVLDRIRMRVGESFFVFQSGLSSEITYRERNTSGGPKDLSFLRVDMDVFPVAESFLSSDQP